MNTEVTPPAAEPEMSGIEVITCFTSVASLLASGGVSLLIVPSIGRGFYGGTALMIFAVLLVQVATLILAVALPSLVMAFCRRLRLSRTPRRLLALAVAGIALEGLALWLIPVTGNC